MVGVSLLGTAALLIIGAATSQAVDSPQCSPSSKCPESAPCCSAYGQCGAGAYCLGGCDPISSFNLKSCMPRPTCKSEDFNLNSLAGMQSNTVYLGDASKVNWVAEGTPVPYHDDSLLLTMVPGSVGTLLASTHYVWYGKISATMKSSGGQGVVTAFIMMSDVKDEIDFEFVGDDLQHVQSNYYWQGTLNYTNSAKLAALDTFTDYHTYTVDWQEDQLTWSVDGVVLRTLKKTQTWNDTTQTYQYPQTPARVQLSLWPAGTRKSAAGTVRWAGGLIDWTDERYMAGGYYYAQLKAVKIECADAPSDAAVSGDGSYIYTNTDGLQSDVAITNDNTVLGSIYASGNNPDFHSKSSTGSGGNSNSGHNVQVVPGISGPGARGSTGGGGASQAPGSSGSGNNGLVDGAAPNKFVQGVSGASSCAAGGRALAVLMTIGALVLL